MQKERKVKFETRTLNGNEIAWGMTFDCLKKKKSKTEKKKRTVSTRDKIKKEEKKNELLLCFTNTKREKKKGNKKSTHTYRVLHSVLCNRDGKRGKGTYKEALELVICPTKPCPTKMLYNAEANIVKAAFLSSTLQLLYFSTFLRY